MDLTAARSALSTVGLQGERLTAVEGGWSYWTFDLDQAWIARFPRRPEIALAAARELALLPELASFLPFAVPKPSHVGRWQDMPFFAYPRLPGEPFDPRHASAASLREVSGMLDALHSFPLSRAVDLLDTGAPETAWRRHFEQLWPLIQSAALPAMPEALAIQVDIEFHTFMERVDELPYCLVHNDLGPEHLLTDPETRRPTGMIDFEEACVGDPAIDFVPLWALASGQARDGLFEDRDLGERLEERLWFYRWMGSVHAIIYGVTTANDKVRQAGLRELPRRLTNKP